MLEQQEPKVKKHAPCSKRLIEILLVLILVTLLTFRVNYSYSSDENASDVPIMHETHYKQLKEIESSLQPQEKNIVNPNINEQEHDFYEIGLKYGTDKVQGTANEELCLKDPSHCHFINCARPKCRQWGHFYHTLFQRKLGHLSHENHNSKKQFQFLEIGFYNGKGFDTFTEFLPSAETHSMEISCSKEWPWDNVAKENENYTSLLEQHRLHCGDASNVTWLHDIWTKEMNRTDGSAPPLKIVVDDGSHYADHMAQTVFFWFPRIEPGGFLIIEDIQPISTANKFRTEFLPQIMADLHYCGDPVFIDNGPCYPTLMPLLASIYCEMHICLFERNDEPARDLDLANSTMPPTALVASQCESLK